MAALTPALVVPLVDVVEGSLQVQERKKRSTIWSFFSVDKSDKTKAVCLTCKQLISRGGDNPKAFNTSNLRKHLEGHADKYKEFVAMEKKRQELELQSSKGKAKQVTLQDLEEKRKPYAYDHPCAQRLTHRIAEMIAIDLQPFSVVEDTGFNRLMAELEPRYVVPSRRYLSDVIMPGIHAKVKHHV